MATKAQHSAAVTKVLTGIQGFDEITEGGLPRGRTTLIMGGPGCGKTVFALQTLVNGARLGKEASVFVAFEESTLQIVANATTFGWDLPALAKKKLFFLDAHLTPEVVKAGDFDLTGLLTAPRSQGQRDPRHTHRLRRRRRAAQPPRQPDRGAPRNLSHPRLAAGDRADRHRHPEGGHERVRTPLQLPPVHGRLRGDSAASGRQRIGLPESSRHQVPRLRLFRRRVSDLADDGRDAADPSRPDRARICRHRRADFVGASPPGPHAAWRLSPRQQRPHLRCAGHRQIDVVRTVRRRRLPARRAHPVCELRRRRRADRAQPPFGRHPAHPASEIGPAQDVLDAHAGTEH